jgi:hypothetical protein
MDEERVTGGGDVEILRVKLSDQAQTGFPASRTFRIPARSSSAFRSRLRSVENEEHAGHRRSTAALDKLSSTVWSGRFRNRRRW